MSLQSNNKTRNVPSVDSGTTETKPAKKIMETIIQKAYKAGWRPETHPNVDLGTINACKAFIMVGGDKQAVLDFLFWQALSTACEWEPTFKFFMEDTLGNDFPVVWQTEIYYATEFQKINVSSSWPAAVEWLESITK